MVLHAVRTSPLRIRPAKSGAQTPQRTKTYREHQAAVDTRVSSLKHAGRPTETQQGPDSQEEAPTAPQEPRHSEQTQSPGRTAARTTRVQGRTPLSLKKMFLLNCSSHLMRGSLRKQMMANLKKSAHSTKHLFFRILSQMDMFM